MGLSYMEIDMVPQNIVNQIEKQIAQYKSVVDQKYKVNLAVPKIDFNLRGVRVAGKFLPGKDRIFLNIDYLLSSDKRVANDMLADTLPHEFAHYAVYKIFGPEFMWTRRGQKQIHHGHKWKRMMLDLGVKPERCHDYRDSEAYSGQDRKPYIYKCQGCGEEVKLGVRRHQRMQTCGGLYHRGCGRRDGKIVFVRMESKQKNGVAALQKQPVQKQPTKGTKLQRCYDLYKQWMHKYDRQGIIAVFVNEVGMTKAGASTYYFQCQKLYQKGV